MAGASVRAMVGATAKATATVPAGLLRDLPNVALINVPLNIINDGTFSPDDTTFNLQISMKGYTNLYQTFTSITVGSSQVGTFITDPYSQVSLLPSTILQAIVDWNAPADFDYSDPDAVFPESRTVVLFLPR